MRLDDDSGEIRVLRPGATGVPGTTLRLYTRGYTTQDPSYVQNSTTGRKRFHLSSQNPISLEKIVTAPLSFPPLAFQPYRIIGCGTFGWTVLLGEANISFQYIANNMRNNYQAITSSADDGDDIRISNGGSDRTRPPLMTWIQGAIAAVLILVAYFTGFYWGGRKTRDTIHPGYVTENVQVPEKDTILTRPFCQSHDGTMKIPPRLLQTSMKQPHLQWAEISCVETTTPNFFQPKPTAMDYLNMYGLPDAILQVNFSQLAHPDRRIPIMGFGGAFTEAAGRNFNRLTKEGQDAVMELLFGATGLGYAIGRFHINSCDFSVDSYTFDDTVDDFELNDFDIGVHHDVETGMVGMALRAVSVLRQSWSGKGPEDGEMFLYASPWSPPAWMKKPTWEDLKRNPNATTAHKMTYSDGPNCLKEGVGPDSRYAKAWALYFSKFLTAYENLGLPLQAVTVQNEPEFPAPWEACSYTPETELDFVANHLGPQLRKDHPDVQLIVFDHNKDHMITWLDTLFNESSKAKPYIAGTAYHWYAGGKI